MKKNKKKISTVQFVVVAFAWLWALNTLFPLIVTFISSLKDNTEIFSSMLSLPSTPRFQNYYDALFNANMIRAILNSLFLAVSTTLLVLIIASLASYVLARKKYFYVKPIYLFFLIGVMIPIHTTIIPISGIAAKLGGYNTYWILILIYTSFQLPQAIFLITGYMQGINSELDEAALIDGCGMLSTLFRIIIPISKPILATVSILTFVYSYSELIFSVILLSSPEKYPISRALLYFKGDYSVRMGPVFASIILAVAPLIIIYLLFHEQVQEGMLSGAIKG